jgi:hypothetical protein
VVAVVASVALLDEDEDDEDDVTGSRGSRRVLTEEEDELLRPVAVTRPVETMVDLIYQ